MSSKVYKVLMSFDDASSILVADAIEEDGHFWLVPEWLGKDKSGPLVPERMILLDREKLHPAPQKFSQDFFLSDPLPAILRHVRTEAEVPPGFQVRFAIQRMAKNQKPN